MDGNEELEGLIKTIMPQSITDYHTTAEYHRPSRIALKCYFGSVEGSNKSCKVTSSSEAVCAMVPPVP